MSYQLLKSIHLLGVVIFLGNIIVTAVWKMLADKTKSPAIVAYAQRLVTITDFSFTAAGVLLILVTGRMMAPRIGEINEVLWLAWGWWLFIASGVVWVLILIPLQIKQAKLAKAFSTKSEVPEKYWLLSRYWVVFGIIATILPLANLYFMVFKPT
ncbi:MAG: DUF2269 domain-containing protein [Candidatus Thiodiazotropha sp. (ex Monitilora ramsayi)]|nr:DUF2269 domain-containing protein [Candidatus Thiodiazotropha sp. (ex Monitilora ramsayi)]